MSKMECIIKFCESLPGTVVYSVKDYIGCKVNSRLYLQIEERKDKMNLWVNKSILSEIEIEKLNIKKVPETYNWTLDARIELSKEIEDIQPYLNIIKKSYESIRKIHKEKIKNLIQNAIENSNQYIKSDMEREEYSFEKLLNKWEEFKNFKISNSDLDELKSYLEGLDKFRSQEILDIHKNDEVKYNFLSLINEVVSYVDLNGFNKAIYNQYEDKRTLALTFVRQKEWVKNLISYKKNGDITQLAPVIRNIILYISSPQDKITSFSEAKILQFCKLMDQSYEFDSGYMDLCKKVYEELKEFDIKVKNEMNRGIVYGKIMYTPEISSLWDKQTTFFKIQPYNISQISNEEVDHYLNENIIISKDKKIEINSNYNILYFNKEKESKMVLGVFTSNSTKDENEVYYRKFEVISEIKYNVEDLPNKNWGSKFSTKNIIAVKSEENLSFENEILNKVFNLDIDELIQKIDSMNLEYSKEDIKSYIKEGQEVYNVENEEDNEDDSLIFEKTIDTPLNTILYGPPGTGKTYNSINYAVSIVEKKEIDEVIEESKKDRESVVKRYKKYLSEKKIVFTTFHQNYSYEEFIQGIRANINNTDTLSFVKQDGIFKELVERAKNDLDNYYVIVIDEINRGNISRIFGELITLIEDDKRLNQPNETTVTLPSKEIFGVPSNIFILGTMNTADKSIALIDIALRRRFEFIPMYTDYSVIPEFEHILKPINKAIYNKKRSADYMIGHSFFVNKSIKDLENIINKQILPLLNEYFYSNQNDIIDVLSAGDINLRQCENTFQLYFDNMESK